MAPRRAFLTLALLSLAACAAPGLRERDHPLAGRIWDPAAGRFVTAAQARDFLAGAGFVLLGETHDNPVHHEIQLGILERIAGVRRDAALALEPLDSESQEAVDAARPAGADAIGIAAKVSPGWEWPRYEPLVAFALSRGWPVVAANLSRERSRAISTEGLASLGDREIERLALDRTGSDARRSALRATLVDGHCGQDGPMIDRLVDVQRARDAVIADRLLAAGRDTVVAIIGRGHARADLGVPLYLRERAPSRRVASLGMVEVEGGRLAPRDYPEAASGVHDLVWFTPRAAREDPCRDFPGIR